MQEGWEMQQSTGKYFMCCIERTLIILLQETHTTKHHENTWKNLWKGSVWFSHGDSNARGIAILIKRDLPLIPKDVIRDSEGRYVLLHAQFKNEWILIGSVYRHNTDQPAFYNSLFECIEQTGVDLKILAGDFNTTLNVIDRSDASRLKNYQVAETIRTSMSTMSLIDVWQVVNPDKPGYTWRNVRPYPLTERLDYILIAESM